MQTGQAPPKTQYTRSGDLHIAYQVVEIRAGLHTGEIEITDHDIGGIAVHIATRIMSAAQPGEILVSSTVKDLSVGCGIAFIDRGAQMLKGVPDEWRLFTVSQ
jgi:class 3 adenylate cyclase